MSGKLKVYVYAKCSTCKKALKWLDSRRVSYDVIPIREQPPSKMELKRMLKAMDGNVRKLFNTSGVDYKLLGLKEELPGMNIEEALTLLTNNGNLVKRPFVIGKDVALVGFKEPEWNAAIKRSN